jgi:hypothetical protein
MHWILEYGDQITVWATVTGMSTSDMHICLVTDSGEACEPFDDGVMDPYGVQEADLDPNFDATVELRKADEVVLFETFSMQSEVGFPDCSFVEEGDTLSLSHEKSMTCLWHATAGHWGTWTVTLDPYGEPTKPTSVFVTLRDHMPGNWCATSENGPAGITGRMKPGVSMSIEWLIPDDGICLRDGMAGEASFGVGTPGTYVLVLEGDLTLKKKQT